MVCLKSVGVTIKNSNFMAKKSMTLEELRKHLNIVVDEIDK
jgi:hypothetical protein